MEQGTISKWFGDKHYGFLRCAEELTGGEHVFFHGSQLAADGPEPRPGMVVQFALEEGPKGYRATRVEITPSDGRR